MDTAEDVAGQMHELIGQLLAAVDLRANEGREGIRLHRATCPVVQSSPYGLDSLTYAEGARAGELVLAKSHSLRACARCDTAELKAEIVAADARIDIARVDEQLNATAEKLEALAVEHSQALKVVQRLAATASTDEGLRELMDAARDVFDVERRIDDQETRAEHAKTRRTWLESRTNLAASR